MPATPLHGFPESDKAPRDDDHPLTASTNTWTAANGSTHVCHIGLLRCNIPWLVPSTGLRASLTHCLPPGTSKTVNFGKEKKTTFVLCWYVGMCV